MGLRFVFLGILAWLVTITTAQKEFQYDYCSIRQSMNSMAQIREEVLPILSHFGVTVDFRQCPIFDQELLDSYFQSKFNYTNSNKNSINTFECPKCKKTFENRDYMEFHWKARHSGPDLIDGRIHESVSKAYKTYPPAPKDKVDYVSGVCLADYCEIFECKDYPDMALKHTTFSQRDHFDYDSDKVFMSESKRNYIKRSNRKLVQYLDKFDDSDEMEYDGKDTTFAFNIRRYSPFHRQMILERCVDLFLSCILTDSSAKQSDMTSAYDVLYNKYCKKFEPGSQNTIYEDPAYLVEGTATYNEKIENESQWRPIKIIFCVICFILSITFYAGYFLAFFD